jgi:hypothetical protein
VVRRRCRAQERLVGTPLARVVGQQRPDPGNHLLVVAQVQLGSGQVHHRIQPFQAPGVPHPPRPLPDHVGQRSALPQVQRPLQQLDLLGIHTLRCGGNQVTEPQQIHPLRIDLQQVAVATAHQPGLRPALFHRVDLP